ncbi:MAG: sigma factor-like helix-turn-helix DNA-binding protein [Bacilli bacterium]|nr:sigma factor-like helix-turn-helix DNA-binding protein [Bacilli bacterium]
MDNYIYYSSLYDYYGKLLTETQQKYFEDYYFNNLSLQEIANNYNVSKNAISKTLIDVNTKLDDYELKLSLYKNKEIIKKTLINNDKEYKQIEKYI